MSKTVFSSEMVQIIFWLVRFKEGPFTFFLAKKYIFDRTDFFVRSHQVGPNPDFWGIVEPVVLKYPPKTGFALYSWTPQKNLGDQIFIFC